MDNDGLVDFVRENPTYLEISGMRSEGVLEALKKVDRKQFLPEGDTSFCMVPVEIMLNLQNSLDAVHRMPDSKEDFMAFMQSVADVETNAKVMRVPLRELAYNDQVIPIGHGQTCSQPSMVALMTDLLELRKGMRVLEVGTGCGYHAAVSSEMVGLEGKVVSVEIIPELASMAYRHLRSYFGEEFDSRFRLIRGDGSMGAVEERVPFDRIYLTAGVDVGSFDYSYFVKQLKEGGILLYPEKVGSLIKQRHKVGEMEGERIGEGVGFVPLVGENT